MENKIRKCALLLGAENHAGKSRLSKELGSSYEDFIHYSIREIIYDRHQRETREPPLKNRPEFNAYAEATKEKEGPITFILEALKKFEYSDKKICIIESLRCPGEGLWVTGEKIKDQFPDIDFLFIGLVAKQDERLRRFLDPSRTDIIADELTVERFMHDEELVNDGTTLWEENVRETLRYAHYTIDNNDGMFDETITQFKNAIASVYTP